MSLAQSIREDHEVVINIQLLNGIAGNRSKYFPQGIGKDQRVLFA
jgi:hypothetical protein